jgi:hypothetical protein
LQVASASFRFRRTVLPSARSGQATSKGGTDRPKQPEVDASELNAARKKAPDQEVGRIVGTRDSEMKQGGSTPAASVFMWERSAFGKRPHMQM